MTSPSSPDRLSVALHTIAEESRPPALPADLWSRGRRRHLRRSAASWAATVLILVAVVALPAILLRGLPWTAPPAQPRPAVPATVPAPLPWQGSARDSPPGPASLVVTGDGPFRGNDAFDGYEDDAMVVGRSGFSRMVKFNDAFDGLLLSPDGRYLAGNSSIEGSQGGMYLDTSVLDLETGEVRTFNVGIPKAWSPDGRLLTQAHGSMAPGLRMLDIHTGASPVVFNPPDAPDRFDLAFSPDGQRLAILSYGTLSIVDIAAGRGDPLIDLPVNFKLAGPGAWTPDGLLAIWDETTCLDVCGGGLGGIQPSTFRMTYVDVATGANAAGPALDTISANTLRLLGWTPDGAAVVHLFHAGFPPERRQTTQVLALLPGGGHSTLINLPRGARNVDVARDVLERGQFGGAAPSTADRIADVLRSRALTLLWIAAIGFAIILGIRLRSALRIRRIHKARPRPLGLRDDLW